MAKTKIARNQSLLRKLELLTTGGLFVALLLTGKTVAKAATVAVAPPNAEPNAAGKTDITEEITQRLHRMTEFAKRSKLTVLEFGAKWCEPCQELKKAIASAQERYGEQVEFVQLDIDDPNTQDLQQKYSVGAVPAVYYLDKDGAVVHQTVGYGGQDWFMNQLNHFTSAVLAHSPNT